MAPLRCTYDDSYAHVSALLLMCYKFARRSQMSTGSGRVPRRTIFEFFLYLSSLASSVTIFSFISVTILMDGLIPTRKSKS